MKKVLSTRTWHNTKHPWEVLIFVLCHLKVERTFVILARLQSRNLNGQSPSCVPNEPFGFMNRRFDLKNVLPYKVLYNHVPPILSQYKSVLDDKFKAWAACVSTRRVANLLVLSHFELRP